MPELMTSAEVAERLRVSRKTLEALVRVGRLRPYRLLGRKWLFDPAEIRAACEASRTPATAAA
jgi:excisionase family DNA binding protein